jgi:hypothetical protein
LREADDSCFQCGILQCDLSKTHCPLPVDKGQPFNRAILS